MVLVSVCCALQFVCAKGIASEKAAVNGNANSVAEKLYRGHIKPILAKHCLKCHGNEKKRSRLDLRTIASAIKGGKSGTALVAGKPEKSVMYTSVLPNADPHMPPKGKALTRDETELIRRWILSLGGNDGWKKPGKITPKPKVVWQPPKGANPTKVIDRLVEEGWKRYKVTPSKISDDRTFVRRVYLDLTGTIPTVKEARQFLADGRKDKRERLIELLVNSKAYARYMREVFTANLLGRTRSDREQRRESQGWSEYLERAFEENRPWDQMTRDMLLARPDSKENRGSVWFLYERRNKHQTIAEAVAPGFFGVQIQCAQCHDHPLANEIKQADYWGLVAIYSRSENGAGRFGVGVTEKAVGGYLQFTSLSGKTQHAPFSFLGSKDLEEKRPGKDVKEKNSRDKYTRVDGRVVPKYSRRAAFVEKIVKGNPRVARSFVNRMWALLMGRGIVHPHDKMDSAHPASHPVLLDWLAKDFESSGYDVKRLVAAIVQSKAYQLDSRPGQSNRPDPAAFATALDKPLIAEAYLRSMAIAMGEPDKQANAALLTEFRRLFGDVLAEQHTSKIQQALFLTNSPMFAKFVKVNEKNAAGRLLKLKTPGERVMKAFEIVFGRGPDEKELRRTVLYLKEREQNSKTAIEQLLWAMLTSAEFRINH